VDQDRHRKTNPQESVRTIPAADAASADRLSSRATVCTPVTGRDGGGHAQAKPGDSLRVRKPRRRKMELMLKAIIHNLMIIRCRSRVATEPDIGIYLTSFFSVVSKTSTPRMDRR